ncbi:MAG: hypothetical protein HON90_10100, partial [Halobacteriovoraceae bacterium]|nr:hypothetical protein [Halobacteriovoraceae bacterium]
SIGLGISKKTKRQTVVGAKNKLSSQVKKAILINKIKHDASSSEELPRIAAQVSTESNPSSATRTSEQQDKRVGFFEDQLNDKSEKDYSCLDESLISRENFISEYRVSIDAIDYSKDKFEKVHDFDIRFQDDLDDISQDYGQGYIDLKYKLNTKMNTRRAVIMPRGHDYMITAFDLVFEGIKKQEISIPVFTKDSFQQIVESKEVTGLGAQVLIELDDTTEDVELDVNTKYEAKLFLDNSLKVVDRSAANYMYVLFVGVNVGNTVIYFKNIKGEVTSKIVSLVDKEVYYEPNFYAEVVNEVFELYQEEPLSKCKGILNINKDSISAWSFESQVTKESINRYSISRMIYPLGTRKYFELKHLEENIFVGRWSEEAVIVPSEDYASLVWNKFDIAQSECLIQLNFTKKPKSIYFNGMSKNGFMNIQSSFLDRDGAFYDEVNVETQRAFLVGEEQGAVNIKVEYIDGSNQFLQTFCSAESYLVEQL